MSGDYFSQLQKSKVRFINTVKVMAQSHAPDYENGKALWPDIISASNQCVLCRQYTPGTERHIAFGREVYVHPMCLAELAAKYSKNSQQTGQESPMGIGKGEIVHKDYAITIAQQRKEAKARSGPKVSEEAKRAAEKYLVEMHAMPEYKRWRATWD